MQPPVGITNESKWIRHCCVIHARACDVLEGKIGIIEAARAFMPLIFWVRANSDPDLAVFKRLNDAVIELPVGLERAMWAAHALAREDVKIRIVEMKWHDAALRAARNLKDKYAWSLDARAVLRKEAREAQGGKHAG
jgi:hypothetical protein